MKISPEKLKCMVISKEPIRCKLEIDTKIIEQVMKFEYLGIPISSYSELDREVQQQIIKANRVAGCLNYTIWNNKHLQAEMKTRIYKSAIRPIITYTAETRPDTKKIERMVETTEMKILRRIDGKTLRDRTRSQDIRNKYNVTNINEWIKMRRIKWNEHIDRMTTDRIVKIARDQLPNGRRSIGRPPKRWRDNLSEEY